MDMQLARAAVRAYPRTDWSDRRAVNAHRRRYIAARLSLGERWLLAKRVARTINSDRAVLAVCLAGWPVILYDVFVWAAA
jgi:hypothetical protein